MRVAFNCSQIFGNSGIETYSREILKNLLLFKQIKPVLFTTKKKKFKLSELLENSDEITIFDNLISPLFLGRKYETLGHRLQYLKINQLDKEFDVFHITNNGFVTNIKNLVVTIHDIIPLKFTKGERLRRFIKSLNNAQKFAKAFIVPSEYVKAELINYNKSFENRTFAIYEAASDDFKISNSKKSFKILNTDINFKYFLFIGRIEERKNIDRIIQSFFQIKSNIDEKLILVLNGEKEDLERYNQTYNNKNGIIIFNGLDLKHLIKLYQNSTAFLFPSLEEGFGLPILEAMKCGAPVITSNLSCMPEIAFDAAILVDPYSIEELSQSMQNISKNSTLRDELIKKGLNRAKIFNWVNAVKQHIEVYKFANEN